MKNEMNFYENLGNWDFSKIKYIVEKENDWDFYVKIKENTTEKSLCLDLGTGGGEKTLSYYPEVRNGYCYRFFLKNGKNCE